jgi:hypothetical protein
LCVSNTGVRRSTSFITIVEATGIPRLLGINAIVLLDELGCSKLVFLLIAVVVP